MYCNGLHFSFLLHQRAWRAERLIGCWLRLTAKPAQCRFIRDIINRMQDNSKNLPETTVKQVIRLFITMSTTNWWKTVLVSPLNRIHDNRHSSRNSSWGVTRHFFAILPDWPWDWNPGWREWGAFHFVLVLTSIWINHKTPSEWLMLLSSSCVPVCGVHRLYAISNELQCGIII